MNATLIAASTAGAALATGASPAVAAANTVIVTVIMIVILGLPVAAATGVLAWHAARGTDPGPAARHLITLVRILWTRPHMND